MKRWISLVVLCLLLSGCAPKLSQQEESGNPWSPEWTAIGTRVGVAAFEGMTLREYNDVQGLDGIYYAAFSWGDSQKITNDSGKEADLYPAQLYLLTRECPEGREAEAAAAQWLAVGESSYRLTELEPVGDFAVYRMEPKNESPFVGGLLALGIHGDTAVSAELMWAEDIFENNAEVLADFLDGLHFRAREG